MKAPYNRNNTDLAMEERFMYSVRRTKNSKIKEDNIAIASRLSGKVRNFTGKTPAVIKVKIEGCLATVQLKWILTNIEKKFLYNCRDKAIIGEMRSKLLTVARHHLNRAFSEVLNSEVKIIDVNEELLQEKLRFQVQVLDLVS